MWFKIDLEGIRFSFRIKGYCHSTEQWDTEWCKVDLILQSENWLNYQINNDELLLTCEIEELLCKIENLLDDNMNHVETMECIEPDLQFVFSPKVDLRKDKHIQYVSNECRIQDVFMELTISFWNDGLTSNKLILTFSREQLELLKTYLQLIANRIDKSNDKVIEMINKGILSDRNYYGNIQ